MTHDKPRVLLLGSGGQLGMQLAKVLAGETELVALSRAEVDFTDEVALRSAVSNAFQGAGPDVLINAAAYTAVDRAESEPEIARQVNALAPGILAEELCNVTAGRGWLVHYSTDYVFDGSGEEPWLESAATGPLSVYGQTKLDGELAIADTGCKHLVLRTSWVYGGRRKEFSAHQCCGWGASGSSFPSWMTRSVRLPLPRLWPRRRERC